MFQTIFPGNLNSKISEFLFLFNHMHEFLHFIYLFIYFSRGLHFKITCKICQSETALENRGSEINLYSLLHLMTMLGRYVTYLPTLI